MQRPQGVRMVPVPAARHSRARARATPFGSRTRFSSSSRPPSQAHPPVHSPTEAGLTSVVSAKDLQPPPRHCVPHRSSVVAPAPPRLGAADKAQNPRTKLRIRGRNSGSASAAIKQSRKGPPGQTRQRRVWSRPERKQPRSSPAAGRGVPLPSVPRFLSRSQVT